MLGVRTAVAAVFLSLTFPSPAHCTQADAGCAAGLQPGANIAGDRELQAEDLVRLRDIGANFDIPVWGGIVPENPKAIAVSPDGAMLAFDMRGADPATNTFCLGIFVMPLDHRAKPILIDEGGELPRYRDNDFRGKAGFPYGLVINRLPHWTRDGKAVLFLKQVGGTVQVWRAQADGSGSTPVTRGADDVIDFRIANDDRTVVYKAQPEYRQGMVAIDTESLSGFHYDARFSPMTSSRPFVPGPLPYSIWAQGSDAGAIGVPANKAQQALFERDAGVPSQAIAAVTSPRGERAWLAIDGEHFPPVMKLWARLADGTVVGCPAAKCGSNISDIWWASDRRLYFMRSEGWDHESIAIYEWRPGASEAHRKFLSRDTLASCVPDKDSVICLREGSVRPRYIDRINLHSGSDFEVFDPNAEFRTLPLGKVERLHWQNSQGLEAFGDLVLPVGYKPGNRYPLVVVQYESRGFLRGGTGDEYPIQLFAAHGFAVLSFNPPPSFGSDVHTLAEAQRETDKDNAARRSNQSALEAGIKLVVDRGIADPDRLGITGLSDGASTVYYALINSHLFKAAAFSSCCSDSSLAISVGPGAMKTFSDRYPSVMSDSDPVWDPLSIAKNAAHLNTPMLIQVPEGELLNALTAITALHDHHQPADMYVFPGEYHVKWQPAHRLAIYRRSLAWFQFWLNGTEAIDVPQDELARWNKLRAERPKQ